MESSFEVEAYSKVGAAGLWQFMRATGKSFGLTVDYNIDERRDPIKATVAAAKLLAYNYRVLQSWPLAITAYNHGTAGMRRAVERTGTREIGLIIERHESPSFKFASKNFYGCFLAASEIAMNYTAYFGSVALFDRAEWTTIALTEYVRPSVLIEHLGISEHQLRRLNPALRPALFQHQKQIPAGFELHLPSTINASDALAKLAAIPQTLKSAKAERPQYYNVQKGDNLYAIASRFGVSAEEIAATNNISSKNKIYAGQVLHIPGTTVTIAQAPLPKPVTPARTAQPAPVVPAVVPDIPPRLPGPPETLPVAPEPPPPAPAVADTMQAVLLAPAESLPSPARVSTEALSQFDAGVYNLDITVSTPGLATFRISINETLSHYAEWLGIPATRIRNANRLHGNSTIRVGQQLTIPLDAPDALERFTRARLEYHLANEEDFYGRFKVEDVRQRTIRRGETLWDICGEEGGTPLWLFKKHNRTLDIERLAPGMLVLMPVTAEKSEEDLALERLEDGSLVPAYVEPLLPRAGFPGLLP